MDYAASCEPRLSKGSVAAADHRGSFAQGKVKPGVALPLHIAKRMRRFDWTTDLRYETGRRDTGETVAFLKTVKAIYDWVEAQLL